jgi:hypothetical protein
MKKVAVIGLYISIIGYIGLILFTQRSLFFSKFDAAYWKDRYDHSQWKLPLSSRTIGDDGLYLFEGYRLIHGGDPSSTNAEVPPLGKYLIGISIVLFRNGYWFGLFATLGLCFMVFLLSRSLGLSYFLSLIASMLILFDPLITNQTTLTMLDSLQSFFLLSTLYSAIQAVQNKKQILWIILTGISLGLFAQTKAPLFVPIVLLSLLPIYLRKITALGKIICIAGITYMCLYVQYFLFHPSIVDFLKLQKWMLTFYTHSHLAPTYGSVWYTLILGTYQNIFNKMWTSAPQFSFAWSVFTFCGLVGVLFFWKKTNPFHSIQSLAILVVALLCVFSFIPFWTRYVVVVLPLLIIGTMLTIQAIKHTGLQKIIIGTFAIVQLVASTKILFPTPESMVKEFLYDWRFGFFQDMYEATDTKTHHSMTRQQFFRFGLHTFADAHIESVAIDPVFPVWSNRTVPLSIPITVTYFTRELGPFVEKSNLAVIRENGQWKISWKWDTMIAGLSADKTLETSIDEAKRGSIIGSDKIPISFDWQSDLVWVTPNNMVSSQEKLIYQTLSDITGGTIPANNFHHRAVGNSIGDIPIPMVVVPNPLPPTKRELLASLSGITLTPHIARKTGSIAIIPIGTVKNADYFECCSWLYSASVYTGADGVEQTKNEVLKGTNGGYLVLKNTDGSIVRTILFAEKKDGQNVQP